MDACFDIEKHHYSVGFVHLGPQGHLLVAGCRRLEPPGTVLGAELAVMVTGLR